MKQWIRWILPALVVAMVMSSCTGYKRGRKKGAGAGDNIGGVMGTEIAGGELALGGREGFMGGTEDASQFEPIYFAYDSSQVDESERGKLELAADFLSSNGGASVIIEGYCDERGSDEYNLALGERRALAVRAYLIGLGVEGERIQTKSYGEENPASFGHEESDWAQNRRAEIVLLY